MRSAGKLAWIDMFKWRDRLPMDIAIQQRLEQQGSHPNIHEYRGYRLSMRQRKCQVYNEFCEYDNLATVLGHYFQRWGALNRLEKGADPPVDMGPGKDWRPIVHSDMHSGNIFVKPPLEGGGGKVIRPNPVEQAELLGTETEGLDGWHFADLGTTQVSTIFLKHTYLTFLC